MPDSAQGHVAPQAPQGDSDAPKHVTEEQLNRAISARLNDHGKRQEKMLSESLASIKQQFAEMFESVKAAPAPVATKEESKIDDSPVVKGMSKQLAEMKAQLEAARQEKAAERSKSREISMRQKVSEELARAGIDSARAKAAIALLVSEERRVRYADDDGDDVSFKDTDGTEVDLVTGIRSWAKSEDAKIFLPAKNPVGSGSRPGGAAPITTPGKIDKNDLGLKIMEAVRNGTL